MDDEQARAILADMRHRAGTLLRALGTDGHGVLSAEGVAAAPDALGRMFRVYEYGPGHPGVVAPGLGAGASTSEGENQ